MLMAAIHRSLFVLIAALLVSTAPVAAQLSLAPTFVYIDSPDQFASLVVTNGSTTVQEVVLDYAFGYPSTDSLGHRFIQYDDDAALERFDLSEWVVGFPQRFRIEPGRRQVVRMMIRPPADLEDGVYWTRMTITAVDASQSMQTSGPTSAHVDFRVKQVIPVVYRQGRSTTQADVTDLLAAADGTGIDLRAVFKRTGDVPFFGSAVLKLMDEDGTTIEEVKTSSEVYFEASTFFRMESADIKPGRYVGEVTLTAERPDIPTGNLPAMKPVTRRFQIDIPDPAALADAE